jgi:hypothetical protein
LFKKDEEWIWADSAYGLDWWCQTPYKKPASLQADNKTFNYHLSRVNTIFLNGTSSVCLLTSQLQVRVKSEHAMGYVKGRFCSLKGLRQQIDDTVDHGRALAWIKACIIIHTLIGLLERGREDPEFMEELVKAGLTNPEPVDMGPEMEASETRRKSRGQKKRAELKKNLFDSGVAQSRQ